MLLPVLGLEIAGIAFLSPICSISARAQCWRGALPASLGAAFAHACCARMACVLALVLLALSLAFPLAGAIASVALAAATGIVGLHIVLEKIGHHRYAAPLARAYAACGWPLSEQT